MNQERSQITDKPSGITYLILHGEEPGEKLLVRASPEHLAQIEKLRDSIFMVLTDMNEDGAEQLKNLFLLCEVTGRPIYSSLLAGEFWKVLDTRPKDRVDALEGSIYFDLKTKGKCPARIVLNDGVKKDKVQIRVDKAFIIEMLMVHYFTIIEERELFRSMGLPEEQRDENIDKLLQDSNTPGAWIPHFPIDFSKPLIATLELDGEGNTELPEILVKILKELYDQSSDRETMSIC